VRDGRIYIEPVNAPFPAAGGSGEEFRAGMARAVALDWLRRHESGTYVKFTEAGAAVFCLMPWPQSRWGCGASSVIQPVQQ
jgi:hypothetical protein